MTNNDHRLSMYEIISAKRDGGELSTAQISHFIADYAAGKIPDYQAAALLMAIYIRGLSPRELADLTRTMMLSGDTISLSDCPGPHIDKHSTGGVGDKISFIVAPLVAACGVRVPMISGRSLGHTGGTLDKLEAIPGMTVTFDEPEFKKILNAAHMIICGQTQNIVPADRKLYALRDSTATVNSIPLISASIMSKKLALATDGIVLDVKTGSGAFMVRLEDSITLCKTMVDIGERSGRRTIGFITDMDQPLGNAVGNSVEIIESMEALKGNGPADLMAVTFALGAGMLLAAGVETGYTQALKRLKATLDSGQPAAIFRKCIAAQGGNAAVWDDYSLLPQSAYREDFCAQAEGYITHINSFEIGMTAIDIGAGRRLKEDVIDHSAGFIFARKVGDYVKKGDPILTLQTNNKESIGGALQRLQQAVTIGSVCPVIPPLIRYLIDKDGMREW